MICGNCGFHNESGDEFCGSCGQFLAWDTVPSGSPAETGAPPSDGATQQPQVTPTAPDVTPVAGVGIRCEDQHVSASSPCKWLVTSARWGRRNSYDYLAVTLEPGPSSADTGAVDAALVPIGDVRSRFGVDPPGSVDIALVLSFNQAVTSPGDFGGKPGYRALKEFQEVRGAQRRLFVDIQR